jgi:hypothetical protein
VKQVVPVVALGAATVIGVLALADATQNRADNTKPGTRSELLLEVETRGSYDPHVAAQGLWAICHQTVDRVTLESFEALNDGRFSIVVEPAIGEYAQRRVVGCLEDFTIDRVIGDVIEVRELAPAAR